MSDAIVIGAGAGGLTAATYLARAGRSVVLLEAEEAPGGVCRPVQLENGWMAPGSAHLLYALDPQVVKELKLARHGLRFAQRDMALTGLRADGGRLTLTRDVHATARQLAGVSEADAATYVSFQRGLLRHARMLRRLWWEGKTVKADAALHQLAVTGAAAFLNSQFESEAAKALMGFDGTDGGLSIQEPGSALTLIWRLAQEVGGLQGATALPQDGPASLIGALQQAATKAGVELRSHARVTRILADNSKVSGVELASGEIFTAPLVLSSLPRARTLDLLPPGTAGLAPAPAPTAMVGEARLLIALSGVPDLDGRPFGTRFVTVERLEAVVAAHAAARAGMLPDEPACEFIIIPRPEGGAVLSLLARPVPLTGWAAYGPRLTEKMLTFLEPFLPGLRDMVVAHTLIPPKPMSAPLRNVAHMLGSPRTHVTTNVPGLYLCGRSAEPVPAVSGRAARFAAALALRGVP